MQTKLWWYDRETYRLKVRQYTDEELADVYYHIDMLTYPEQYYWVLIEMRRRALVPSESDRPLPNVRWWLPQWLSHCPSLARYPLIFNLSLAGSSALLAFVLTLGGLLPFYLLVVLLDVVNAAAALVYVALLPIPITTGFIYTVRAGSRGWFAVFALLGTGIAFWLFLQSGFFSQLMEAISRPHHSVPFINFPM